MMQSSSKTLVIDIKGAQSTAQVKLLDKAQVEVLFARGLGRLSQMRREGNTTRKLGATQPIFRTMLEFGNIVAEAYPAAKTVFAVCTCAWERLEEQQKLGRELEELAERLVGMIPLVEEIKKYARLEPIHRNVEEFLHLIEDVSIFALGRTRGSVGRLLQGLVDSGERERLEDLATRFQKIRGDFDTAIGIQVMAMVSIADERELLKELNPVEPIGHDPSKGCQEGTRLAILGDIDRWIKAPDPSPSLMWIHGQAGIGKSTISVSVCNRLAWEGVPVISFFCKRDDPALRDPLRLINSVAYGLAYRCPPYGKLVTTAIAANPELCKSHLGVRYEGLFKKPLSELMNKTPSSSYVVLVDALDECGADETRKELVSHLQDLSSLVPWLKLIVTSRPDNDILSAFDRYPAAKVSRTSLQDYTATNDIQVFIKAQLSTIDMGEDWPIECVEKLCTKAGELFIWAATACKLIISAFDPHDQLQRLVDEGPPGSGLDNLDFLYMTVIRNCATDQLANSTVHIRQCVGAIVVTSMRQPVPIGVLCELMRKHIKPVVVRNVVKRLGAVLYMDERLDGAIRVYHPSFADFSLDERRSCEFWVDPVQRDVELLIGCVSTMERELRFNICELETSHLPNKEVQDLELKIASKVTGQLAYSCTYWISHLLESADNTLVHLVEKLVDGSRLLFWLEVLSLLQRVDVALRGLRELSYWLESFQEMLAPYVWDAYRFVFAFFDPIATSAPHIYISALAFAPKESEISRQLLPLFPNIASVISGGDEKWPEWLRSMSHPEPVTSICISPDSRLLITCCQDLAVRTFNVKTGELLNTFYHPSANRNRNSKPMCVAISSDGARIVASIGGDLQLWNSNTGDPIDSVNIPIHEYATTPENIQALGFSPDGVTILVLIGSAVQTMIKLWSTVSKGITDALDRHDLWDWGGTGVFSADGTHLALASSNELVITAFPPGLHQVIPLDRKGPPESVIFSSDRSLVCITANSFFDDGRLQIWNTETRCLVSEILADLYDIISTALSPDGARLVTGSRNNTVQIWDTQTGGVIGDFVGHSDSVTSVAFSPDGHYIISGSLDRAVLVWESPESGPRGASLIAKPHPTPSKHLQHKKTSNDDPKIDFELSGHSDTVLSVSFSRNGRRIVSGSYDRTVRVWDTQTGAAIGNPYQMGEAIMDVAFSSHGDYIMIAAGSAGQPDSFYLLDTKMHGKTHIQLEKPAAAFAFSPDGTRLATAEAALFGAPTIIWDTNTGGVVGTLGSESRAKRTRLIAFSPDGSQVYLCNSNFVGDNTEIHIWEVRTLSRLKVLHIESQDHATPHTISPDGAYLVLIHPYNGPTVIHDAHTGSIVSPLRADFRGHPESIAFSQDGVRLACSYQYRSHVICVWDIKTGMMVMGPLRGHLSRILSLSFSPDGSRLVSCSSDKTIRLWDVSLNNIPDLWRDGNISCWPSNTFYFPLHPSKPGWVSHDGQSLTLWIPDRYRRVYDPRALRCISADPPVHIDFSKFVHGTVWTSVISEETLQDYKNQT